MGIWTPRAKPEVCKYTCTIVASKIKGTAREIYRIFPCNGDFPCIFTGGYTGKIPSGKATNRVR